MKPSTYLLGYTDVNRHGMEQYLRDTGQDEFLAVLEEARQQGIHPGEALCSFYAKMCYKSLVLGKNSNVTKIRGIKANLESVIDTGHGSVLEHCNLNFVTTNCSRVFTHEMVRHRVGTAFSQTSGRYVSLDDLQLVIPPELEGDPVVEGWIDEHVENTKALGARLRKRLIDEGEECPYCDKGWIGEGFPEKCDTCGGPPGRVPVTDFGRKKKITSAIRRIFLVGATNEIGWSVNIRSLRHVLEMRTSRHAEWEIRLVFNQVARLVEEKFPMILCGGEKEEIDGLLEYTGLKV